MQHLPSIVQALVVAGLPVGVAAVGALPAQCANQFVPTLQFPGTDGIVRAVTVWDRDGAGPLPPLVVAGGSFTQAGTTSVSSIAAHDPQTGAWSALGTGVGNLFSGGEVLALATASNGDLIVGGEFTIAGGTNFVLNIARWDGAAWSMVGSGLSGAVHALTVLANGDIVAGGEFTLAGGVSVDHIARWDGTSWLPLGTGTDNTVRALTKMPNGDVVAGGDFSLAGGVSASRVARWNGTTWSAMHTGCNATVRALAMQGTTLWAGGDFTSVSGVFARGIASWSGTTWLPSLNGVNNLTRVHAIATTATEIYIGGNRAGSGAFNSVAARFDGSAWSQLESNNSTASTAYAMTTLPNGRLVVGGSFDNVDRTPAYNLATGPQPWAALGTLSGFLGDVVVRADGALVVTGEFTAPGIPGFTSLGVLSGGQWTSQQGSIAGRAREAFAMPGGDIVILVTDAPSGDRVHRWTGAAWTQVGPALATWGITAFAALPNGDLVGLGYDAAGDYVRRWNGVAWVPLGFSSFPGLPEAMTALPNGDLVVSTTVAPFSQPPQLTFWKWDGTTWSPLGTSQRGQQSTALAALPNGGLVAGGDGFGALLWNGTSWAPMGIGAPVQVSDLLVLPDGDVLACGRFTVAGTANANRLARWNGTAWLPIGPGADGDVLAMTRLPNGDVVFAGGFARVGNAPSPGLGRLTTTCPATVTPVGSACLGSAGPLQLGVVALPWLGGTFHAAATGFAPGAVGLRVFGLQPFSLPLSSVLPVGSSTCSLLAQPDDVALMLPVAGAAAFALAIPDAAAVVGLQFHSQVLQLELGPLLQMTALGGSNALFATIGSF